MRELIRHILKEETSFVNHKGEYQKYDKIINKLVYLVFDEGICSFTWDAFEIPTRNGHVTQIILNFTPESFRELGYEKYHKLRTELKDAIMDYVPLFTQVYVAYDTTKCDDQLNESEHKQPKYLKVIESILEPFKDKDCVCDIKAKYKEEDDYYFVNIIVSNRDLDNKFPTNPQIRYYLGKLKREVSNYLHEYLPITFFVEIEDTPNCAGYNEYRNKLNESEDKKNSLLQTIENQGLYNFIDMSGLSFRDIKPILSKLPNVKGILKQFIRDFIFEKGTVWGENGASLDGYEIPLSNEKYIETIEVFDQESIKIEVWVFDVDQYGDREQKDQYVTSIKTLTNDELLAIVAWMMESIKEGTINESIVVKRRLDDLTRHITSTYKWLNPKRFDNFDEFLERVIFNVVRDFVSEIGDNQDYETQLKVREEIKPFVTQYIIDNYLEDIKYYFGIFT